jgi:hypothetical protein
MAAQSRQNGSREHPKVLRRNRMSDTSTGTGKVVGEQVDVAGRLHCRSR